jgi:hypothetical protein
MRSPQPSGRRPPVPPSPLGGSAGTCRGLAKGSASLPHFCYPVSSPMPLSPECTRISRHRTPVQHLCHSGMLDRLDIRYQGPKVLMSSWQKRASAHGSARRSPVRRSRERGRKPANGPVRMRVMDRTGFRGKRRTMVAKSAGTQDRSGRPKAALSPQKSAAGPHGAEISQRRQLISTVF